MAPVALVLVNTGDARYRLGPLEPTNIRVNPP